MNRIKHPPAALFGLCALLAVTLAAQLAPLAPAGAAEKGPRRFYLTKTTHDGSQALSACASGYHMASLWEILDPSNLRYDTELGETHDEPQGASDTGSGPPSQTYGWIRTGYWATVGSPDPGSATCASWRSANSTHTGNTLRLTDNWSTPFVTAISPWEAVVIPCDTARAVWCVQD
jgi:hypothetical protein